MAYAYPITADVAVSTVAARYCGFSFEETGDTDAYIRIYDSAAASGTLLDSVHLVAGESAREWYGEDGIRCSHLYVDITGAVQGSLRVG